MKKLLKGTSLLLMLALVLTTISPMGALANRVVDTESKTSTTNVITFDDLGTEQTLANYLYSNGGYFNFDESNAASKLIEALTVDTEVKLCDDPSSGASNKVMLIDTTDYYRSEVFFYRDTNNTTLTDNFEFSFSCYPAADRPMTFKVGDQEMITFAVNKVYAFKSVELCSAPKNNWYDVKFTFSLSTKMAKIGIKSSSASEWTFYNKELPAGHAFTSNNGYGATVAFGVRITDGTAQKKAYIDNVYFNNIGVSDVVPVYYESDFNEDGDFESSTSPTTGKWHTENFGTDVTATLDTLAGYEGKVLQLAHASADAQESPNLNMLPFGNNPTDNGATHSINFKLGYDDAKATAKVIIGLANVVENSGNNGVTAVMISNGQLFLNGETSSQCISDVTVLPNKLYDISVLYKGDGTYKSIIFTDLDGTQYKRDLNLGNGALRIFRLNDTSNKVSKTYLDDFSWKAFYPTAFAATGDALISGYETTGAALDDGAEIKLNQTPDLSNGVTVTVTKDGEAVTPEYKLIDTADGMAVKFTKLDKNAAYEVTVSGIKNMAGTALADQTVSFTTLDYDYVVSKPEISASNVVTVNAKSAYLDFGAYIIVAKYNGRVLADIDQKVININSNEIQSFTFDPGFTDATELKAFVWSDYQTLIPLSESSAK